jgi:hypothetical protein
MGIVFLAPFQQPGKLSARGSADEDGQGYEKIARHGRKLSILGG